MRWLRHEYALRTARLALIIEVHWVAEQVDVFNISVERPLTPPRLHIYLNFKTMIF